MWNTIFTDDSKFPNDGSAANARNYCRNPEHKHSIYCYLLYPKIPAGMTVVHFCDEIPLCG